VRVTHEVREGEFEEKFIGYLTKTRSNSTWLPRDRDNARARSDNNAIALLRETTRQAIENWTALDEQSPLTSEEMQALMDKEGDT
jgi:hypothetical protein